MLVSTVNLADIPGAAAPLLPSTSRTPAAPGSFRGDAMTRWFVEVTRDGSTWERVCECFSEAQAEFDRLGMQRAADRIRRNVAGRAQYRIRPEADRA